jgi:glutaredoxin
MPRTEPVLVTVFTGQRCHLCEAALEVIDDVRTEISFALEIVDITGDEDLEARYRESIPVIEIDGKRVFTYHVTAEGLRAALH